MSIPSLTRLDVIKRAWPLVFANAAVPLAGVADTFVLGLSGDKADLGGVALGGALFSVFYWSFYFLRMGTTGLTAQADGAGDRAETQRILLRALAIAGALGLLVFLLRDLIALAGFAILQGEARVEDKGADYLLARAWGTPAALACFALSGWLIGLGRNAATLAIYIAFSIINIGLDLWFVLGLGHGPGGVGAATAIAEWVALLIGLGFMAFVLRGQSGWAAGVLDRAKLLDPAAIRELFQVNVNLMIRTWSLVIGFTWFANAGARQGTAALAGNHVLLQVISVWAFVLDAFAFVAETEAGRAFGRRSVRDLRRSVQLTGEPMLIAGGAIPQAVLTALPPVDLQGGDPFMVAERHRRQLHLQAVVSGIEVHSCGQFRVRLHGMHGHAVALPPMRDGQAVEPDVAADIEKGAALRELCSKPIQLWHVIELGREQGRHLAKVAAIQQPQLHAQRIDIVGAFRSALDRAA